MLHIRGWTEPTKSTFIIWGHSGGRVVVILDVACKSCRIVIAEDRLVFLGLTSRCCPVMRGCSDGRLEQRIDEMASMGHDLSPAAY